MSRRLEADELTNRGLAQRVLYQVNEVRRALAIGERKLDRLPKGVMGNSQECVLARALSNGWHPKVSGGACGIGLWHPDDGTVDWKAAAETLTQQGFRNVIVRLVTKTGKSVGYHRVRGREIRFDATSEMNEVIGRFDDGLMKHLILERD